jgi:hypothetical protein
MAAFAGKGVAATAHLAGTKLSTVQLSGRLRIATDSITLTAAADIGATMKLCWIPYGATILDGFVNHGDTDTNVTIKGGVVGVSGTTYDNNDDIFFTALACATEAESRSAPKRLQLMKPVTDIVAAAPTPGYKVTDPAGAYIILTTAGAANGAAAAKFFALVEYVMD